MFPPIDRRSRIFLTGMMGAGKSSVGECLSRRLGLRFIDLDAEIAANAGMSVAEMIRREGILKFRKAERETLRTFGAGEAFVMATGGGIVEDPGNRDYMRGRGVVVHLSVPMETLVSRLSRQADSRPLLDGGDIAGTLDEILERRAPWYADADVVVAAGEGDPEAVAARVLSLLEAA